MRKCLQFFHDVLIHLGGTIGFPMVIFVILFGLSIRLSGQNCTVNAGVEDSICLNKPMQLHGNSAGLFQGSGNLHWFQKSGPSVNIVNPYDMNTFVTGYVANATYWFYLSGKCQDGSLALDSVWMKVFPMTIANAGPDLNSCPGTTVLTLAGN